METTVELLNKIANKLGDENADQYTTVAQALGSIANALGNADPDKIQTVPEALQEILAVAGGGGGGSTAKITFDITPPEGVTLDGYVSIKFSTGSEETVAISADAYGLMTNFVLPLSEIVISSPGSNILFFDADENMYGFSAMPQTEGNIVIEGSNYVITGDCKITGTVVLRS